MKTNFFAGTIDRNRGNTGNEEIPDNNVSDRYEYNLNQSNKINIKIVNKTDPDSRGVIQISNSTISGSGNLAFLNFNPVSSFLTRQTGMQEP